MKHLNNLFYICTTGYVGKLHKCILLCICAVSRSWIQSVWDCQDVDCNFNSSYDHIQSITLYSHFSFSRSSKVRRSSNLNLMLISNLMFINAHALVFHISASVVTLCMLQVLKMLGWSSVNSTLNSMTNINVVNFLSTTVSSCGSLPVPKPSHTFPKLSCSTCSHKVSKPYFSSKKWTMGCL